MFRITKKSLFFSLSFVEMKKKKKKKKTKTQTSGQLVRHSAGSLGPRETASGLVLPDPQVPSVSPLASEEEEGFGQ